MPRIENMTGAGLATNYSGVLALDGGVSYIKSGDYSGVAYGAGIGAGVQLTESVNWTWMSEKFEWERLKTILPLRPGQGESNPLPLPIFNLLTTSTATKTAENAAKALILSAKPVLSEYINSRTKNIVSTVGSNSEIISSLNKKIQSYDNKKQLSILDKAKKMLLLAEVKIKEAENAQLSKEAENLEKLKSNLNELSNN